MSILPGNGQKRSLSTTNGVKLNQNKKNTKAIGVQYYTNEILKRAKYISNCLQLYIFRLLSVITILYCLRFLSISAARWVRTIHRARFDPGSWTLYGQMYCSWLIYFRRPIGRETWMGRALWSEILDSVWPIVLLLQCSNPKWLFWYHEDIFIRARACNEFVMHLRQSDAIDTCSHLEFRMIKHVFLCISVSWKSWI